MKVYGNIKLGIPPITLSIQIVNESQNQAVKPINDWHFGMISNLYWFNQDDLNLCNKLNIHNLAFKTFTSAILLFSVVTFRVEGRLLNVLNYVNRYPARNISSLVDNS